MACEELYTNFLPIARPPERRSVVLSCGRSIAANAACILKRTPAEDAKFLETANIVLLAGGSVERVGECSQKTVCES